MDFNKLFSKMTKKGYRYFDGNEYQGRMYFSFTTLDRGKGNEIEIIVKENEIKMHSWIRPEDDTPYIESDSVTKSEDEFFAFIEGI